MEKRRIDTFEAAVEYLYHMPRFTAKHSMEDTIAHLVRLSSPDQKIKRIIHVAGTNGKGSVCTYLQFCLREAGYHVGVFTSPHLVDIRERFMLDGELIEEAEFLRLFQVVYESLDWETLAQGEGYHPTFFEYLFFFLLALQECYGHLASLSIRRYIKVQNDVVFAARFHNFFQSHAGIVDAELVVRSHIFTIYHKLKFGILHADEPVQRFDF